MSLSQAGRQAINPITGEQRFQAAQVIDFRRSDQPVRTAEPRKIEESPQQFVPQQKDVVYQLQEQVQMLEKSLTQEVKRNSKMLVELEREVRMRGQIADPNQLFDDFQNKMYSLETKLIAQERSKSELGSKLAIQEQNLKELMFFIKNTQNKDTNEVLQMRGMLQEKITEESSQLNKEREKSKALFLEMVRLGELHEKLQESLSLINQQFETRMMTLEGKIYNGEKALVQVAQRGDSGMNFINETNERIEKRVMSLEANLLALGKDQLKDHDQIQRVDSANQRIQEEFKGMLQLLQQDYNQRLDTRITEVINRIVMEHEQRAKAIEEMKQSWALKDQVNMERIQYQHEELSTRLSSAEQLQRIDSAKKDEAIRSIQAIIETQVNQILVNIQNEEAQRYAHEVQLRGDLLKIQENIKQENELFKTHQANITEKITDMIRIEVQTRLSTDTDLKNLTSAIATDIVSDLNSLKDQIESQNRVLQQQVKQLERDSGEKAERLSLYIDEEINKAVKVQAQKYEKVKVIFSKFGESFKQHIIAYEGFKQDIGSRQQIIEQNIDIIRQEFQQVIEDQQIHLLECISREKNQILEAVNATMQILEDKVNKLDEDSANKFRIFKDVVEENQRVVIEKTRLILEQNETFQNTQMKGMKLMGDALTEFKQQQQQMKEDLTNQIISVENQTGELKKENDQQQEQLNQQNKLIEEHRINLDKHQDDLDVLLKENEDIKIKQEDIEKTFNNVLNEQEKIRNSHQILNVTVDKLSENIVAMSERVDALSQNQTQQQDEVQKLELRISKLDNDVEETNNKLNNESQRLEGLIDKQNKNSLDMQDKWRGLDDSTKQNSIDIDELKQSVKHLQDRTKQLAQIPT